MALLWIAAAALTAFVAHVLNEIRKIGIPTTGAKIDKPSRPCAALLVIDMQSDFATFPAWTAKQVDDALAQIQTLVTQAHSSGVPVIEVWHVFRGCLANLLNGWFSKGHRNEG